MIDKKDLIRNTEVRNIKYGTLEVIQGTGVMKTDDGQWVDCVIYMGIDRFDSHKVQTFVKRTSDFINEFEVVKPAFDTWMEGVYSLLECNNNSVDEITFTYSKEDIDSKLDYFLECFQMGMSPYKSLCLYE